MAISYSILTDQQLVAMALQRKAGAYDELVGRYQTLLESMLSNRGVSDPQDIVQDSFVKAYLNLSQYNSEYSFGQWITAIARNIHIDITRRKRDNTSSLPLENLNTPCGAPNPEQTIILEQSEDLLNRQLEMLPKNYKTILKLRFWEDMSYEEIAEKLAMPLGTVKTQIHRGRHLLLDCVKK